MINTQEDFSKPILTFDLKEKQESNITFITNQNELLRIAEDGFYVRGKKLDIDDEEARSVYRAFKEFLVWSALTRT
jgi:phage-related protein